MAQIRISSGRQFFGKSKALIWLLFRVVPSFNKYEANFLHFKKKKKKKKKKFPSIREYEMLFLMGSSKFWIKNGFTLVFPFQ